MLNYRPLVAQSGLRNNRPPNLAASWGQNTLGYFDFSPDSDQLSNNPSPSQTPTTVETEPWTPPADAHPQIDLHEFVRGAWRILEPAVPFVDGWHIALLCSHLQALSTGTLPERNLLINEPPGSSKSLITAVLWPAWEWTWAPWRRWLTSSYDEKLALRDALRTRRLMQSAWYLDKRVDPWSFTSDQNVKGYYINNRTGWRIATSIGGGVTGNHAHVVLVDDPHNVRQAESDTERQAVLTTWREVYPSRVLPGGARVLIGQRVHEEDCTADWLEREGKNIHHIELQEEFEKRAADAPEPAVCALTDQPHDIRKDEGELLTPERFSRETIEQRKIELGPYAYAAQYQQRPTPRTGMVLDQDWFTQTPTLELSQVDLIMAFDLNYSESSSSDWTVGMLAAVERTPVLPMIHIVDVLREHTSERTQEQVLGDWICLWRPILVGIEKRAYEREGATMDLCRRLMQYCEERGVTVAFEPVIADADKVTRAQIITGRAKARRITADRRAHWWAGLARELSTFPKSEHDDQVDTLAYVVRLAVEKLEKVRSKMRILGSSVAVRYEEAPPASPDWQRATLAGIR